MQEKPKICPVCKEGDDFDFIKDYKLKEGNFSLYECLKCKVQFYSPFKKIESKDYEAKDSYNISRFLKPAISRGYHKKFLQSNKKFPQGTTVLDLGCGTGEFLSELEKRGCKVFGVDFDGEAIKSARRHFNLQNVYDMPFEDFFKKEDLPRFDFIFCFEVLQYLDMPLEFAKNLRKILKPGGRIILSQPSKNRMLQGVDEWDLPSHCLTRWDKESILNLFSRSGFKISCASYVEQMKILRGALNSRLRFGLVAKAEEISKNRKVFFSPRFVYFLGRVKGFVISFFPAFFLWFGKILKKENGIIYLELRINE
ncbi:MAG: class I SAM-dependent methyltransferase [Candidatus Staskawiczbacteria bacterium]|nr:class I SAM-dependent methyltransferase [Candidatus Staskawiczbacteria bacterium]